MATAIISDEAIARLFAEGRLTPAEFELTRVEVRRHGRCYPTEWEPCVHVDETCNMLEDVYRADGTSETGRVHCDTACRNLDDDGLEEVEGIGGEYAAGGTFSYITDDRELLNRVFARIAELAL